MRLQGSLLLLLCFFQFVHYAEAGLIVPYPGLEELQKQADVVAIVKVETRAYYDYSAKKWLPRTKEYDPIYGTRSGGGMDYFFSTVVVLKGTTETLRVKTIELDFHSRGLSLKSTKKKALSKIDRLVLAQLKSLSQDRSFRRLEGK